MVVRILLVEPLKDLWFVMGEYMPPPLGILELAAYLEAHDDKAEIQVLDCQAEGIGWSDLPKRIESFAPDVFAPSGLATCNAYTVLRAAQVAKQVSPDVITVVGGQQFTAMAEQTLRAYPEIDVVVRGEGERTLLQLTRALAAGAGPSRVRGISFRNDGRVVSTPEQPLIEDLDELPLPGYHFVKEYMHRYHFKMMVGPETGYALLEGSRGCSHRCTFCSQWRFWRGACRTKSNKRIADEMEHCYAEYGTGFLWLTDDNFNIGERARGLCEEIKKRGIADDIMWFVQARCDDIVNHKSLLPSMRRAGNLWVLTGVESNSPATLQAFRKGTAPSEAKLAIQLLKQNGIFSQGTFIMGHRKETHESVAELRQFANTADPDLAIFMVLTPFPGTELYETAVREGWIEDTNWANYDMVHAVMPTETLSREDVQEELYECYRSFYGNVKRRLIGLLSSNEIKRRTYRYLAGQSLLKSLRGLF